jgi:hypothetical protein
MKDTGTIDYPERFTKLTDNDYLAKQGWKLVRFHPKDSLWHAATDDLRGTHAYGKFDQFHEGWSRHFYQTPFNEFLFSTGDAGRSYWLQTSKASILPDSDVTTC